MQTMITELTTVLKAEFECYGQLDRLLDRETSTLSLSRHDDFDRIQLHKESLVETLQQLETNRLRVVRHLAETLGMQASRMRVSELMAQIGPPQDTALKRCSARLRKRIAAVQAKNRRNQQLIDHHLALVSGSMQLLSDLVNDSSVYPGPGNAPSVSGYSSSGGRLFCQNI